MTYRILMVEDNKDVVENFHQALDDEGISAKFEIINVKNKLEAEEALKNERFHLAVMDLKIPLDVNDNSADPQTGVSLLKTALSEHLFPMIVVTATPGVLDPENDESLPRTLTIKAKEGGVYSEVAEYLNGLTSLFDILPQFDEAEKTLKKDFAATFWDLYGHWANFKNKFQNPSRVSEVMRRHIAHYLVEKWTAEGDGGLLHHSEFYSHPPFRNQIYTGDIVQHDNRYWIVVTAPCDLSNGEEPEEITLLECVPVEYADKSHKRVVVPFKQAPPDEGKQKDAMNKIKGFFTNPGISRHYLPSWASGTSPHYIEFKRIKTIPLEIANKLTVVANLNSHFMPYVMQRYGFYVSRLGQPEISADDYLTYLLTKVPDEEIRS